MPVPRPPSLATPLATPFATPPCTRIDFADPHAATQGCAPNGAESGAADNGGGKDESDSESAGNRWALTWTTPPQQVWQAHQLNEVAAVLDAAHAAAKAGAWCVGHVRYEAAPAFDAALTTHPHDPATGPLAWFAAFDPALAAPTPTATTPAGPPAQHAPLHWVADATWADFQQAMARVQAAIAAGECYQVNLTTRLRAAQALQAPALHSLFAALQAAQPGGYAACYHTGDEAVLSLSPELFFAWDGQHLLTRPMKGTAPRGDTPEADAAQAHRLRTTPKEQAENVMIVDLLRNDVSRIAQPHSVRVPRLFHTQALPTVWQMTSDVSATTRPGLRLSEVFAALFPCGSVTGAPKAQAMKHIVALEPTPRGIYCGAVGVMAPGGAVRFNVPIRTVTLRQGPPAGAAPPAVAGVGSGITFDATAEAEWAEWRHKQAFLHRANPPFELLETLALVDGQLRHADRHLARMAASAAHFGWPWSTAQAHAALAQVQAAHPQGAWRVRLLTQPTGPYTAQAFALPPTVATAAQPLLLQLAPHPLAEAHTDWVAHKTTWRAHYDAFTPTDPAVFDTLLFNAQGQITECTRGNIAACVDGRWVTPPLHCGLLPGVGRALALAQGRVVEQVISLADVPRITAWAFVNSLRGWLPARLAHAAPCADATPVAAPGPPGAVAVPPSPFGA